MISGLIGLAMVILFSYGLYLCISVMNAGETVECTQDSDRHCVGEDHIIYHASGHIQKEWVYFYSDDSFETVTTKWRPSTKYIRCSK